MDSRNEPHSIRITLHQRTAITECLRDRITELRTHSGRTSARPHATYLHGGDDKYREIRALQSIARSMRGLPPTLTVYESEWPAFSRALRAHPKGAAFYHRLTRSKYEGEAFSFTTDKSLRAAERRQKSRARPLGRPRKSWSSGEPL